MLQGKDNCSEGSSKTYRSIICSKSGPLLPSLTYQEGQFEGRGPVKVGCTLRTEANGIKAAFTYLFWALGLWYHQSVWKQSSNCLPNCWKTWSSPAMARG